MLIRGHPCNKKCTIDFRPLKDKKRNPNLGHLLLHLWLLHLHRCRLNASSNHHIHRYAIVDPGHPYEPPYPFLLQRQQTSHHPNPKFLSWRGIAPCSTSPSPLLLSVGRRGVTGSGEVVQEMEDGRRKGRGLISLSVAALRVETRTEGG